MRRKITLNLLSEQNIMSNQTSLTRKLVITSEYIHYFVLLTILSLIPLLLVKEDTSGFMLSMASILANVVVIFLLPVVVKRSKSIRHMRNLIIIRLITLCAVMSLLLSYTGWGLCLVQAVALLALSFQQVNANRSFQEAGVTLNENSTFKFEISSAIVGFLAALAMYFSLDFLQVAHKTLIITLIVCLLINLLSLIGASRISSSCITTVIKPTKAHAKTHVSFAKALLFCRTQLSFLAQRLLWFIAPLWFAQTTNVNGFTHWLLISSFGVLLAIWVVKLKTHANLNLNKLFVLSNAGLIACIAVIAVNPSDLSMYFAGIVCTLAIPIQRTYARQQAANIESENHSAAELIAHGNKLIRLIHLVLVLLFPLTMQIGGLGLTSMFSLFVITLLAVSHKILPVQNYSLIRS